MSTTLPHRVFPSVTTDASLGVQKFITGVYSVKIFHCRNGKILRLNLFCLELDRIRNGTGNWDRTEDV